MEEAAGQTICRVCHKQFAKYTCPRCNLRYCSIVCYKGHSERCTENFFKEQAQSSLKETKASHADKQKMLQILQRLHAQDTEQAYPIATPAPDAEQEEDAEDEEELGGLSQSTLEKLRLQVEAGQDPDIREEDLTPGERAAFRRALASGRLASLVDAWAPWWAAPGAAGLTLGADGLPAVMPLPEDGQGFDTDGNGVYDPLPKLGSLTRAPASPLLRWQLLDLLYAYCLVLRLHNGDWEAEPQGAAAQLLDVSTSLTAKTPPQTGCDAATQAVQRACAPTILGHAGRAAAVSVLRDVAAITSIGRPAALRALSELRAALRTAATSGAAPAGVSVMAGLPPAGGVSRLAEARRRRAAAAAATAGRDATTPGTHLDPRSASAPGDVARKMDTSAQIGAAARRQVSHGAKWDRQLAAAERKVFFTMCWANEAPPSVFVEVAAAADAEVTQLEATLVPTHVRSDSTTSVPAHAAGGHAGTGGPKNGHVTAVSSSGNPGKEALQAAAVRHLTARGALLEPTGEALPETLKVVGSDSAAERVPERRLTGTPLEESCGGQTLGADPLGESVDGGAGSRSPILDRRGKIPKPESTKVAASEQVGEQQDAPQGSDGTGPAGDAALFHGSGQLDAPRKVMIQEIIARPEREKVEGLAPRKVMIQEICASPEREKSEGLVSRADWHLGSSTPAGSGNISGESPVDLGTLKNPGAEGGEGEVSPGVVEKISDARGRWQGGHGEGSGGDLASGEGLPPSDTVVASITPCVAPLTPEVRPRERRGMGLVSGGSYIGIPRFEELD